MSTQTNEKVYVNSLWFEEKIFDDGGSILKVNAKADELVKFLKENKNADGYVKLVISKKKNIEPGKSTHYAYLDTWQPTNRTGPTVGPTSAKVVSKPTKKVPAPVEQEEELI